MFISKADIEENLIREACPDQKRGRYSKLEFVIPRLNNWVIQYSQNNIHVSGTLKNHKQNQLGARIKTSKIICFHKVNGRSIISTRNSIYELGEPAIQLQGAHEHPHQNLQQKVSEMPAQSSDLDPDPSDFTRLAHNNS